MAKIAFFGLGNMGASMAKNLVKAKFNVTVFDLVGSQVQLLAEAGATPGSSVKQAVESADIIISMLPAGKHVESLYFDEDGIVNNISAKSLFIDCSTIESSTAKSIGEKLQAQGHRFIDAPVSGGVAGAAAGSLTFIVGGDKADFDEAQSCLQAMGKNIFHAGGIGAGQVAKICNNMLLAILMAGTSEALQLGIDNGLDPKVMSDIMLQSSGRNWTLELYNPCPGVMPNVPSSNDYQGGFLVDLMNKDLGLAMGTAANNRSVVPLGQLAKSLFQMHGNAGNGNLDFSSIFNAYKHG
ncbi:3-hydroxyisobutyrate dehydrogenase [Brumicola pallidula]|jgi:3-hydroxyisobutyrate dehydrogenase|uniref:3-hydroxyisobutyrate dehydrogenase n=1 Tax=Brumicola pallidula DSM 14239 = ACAM 615 TaxID=1121922 RepID=K6YW02_9ALTE|nr:3-hydroxyisobutyrate dehydrogenase [Glaciecola pallidula]GAC28186.1 3-hydroxyisobutyrate dehydrogenase [Glaciecola pallidula DSM 14239 = ACAM 615]